METIMSLQFPPSRSVGTRVWTELGYLDHGPFGGPKATIPAKLAGTIVGTEKPYVTMDQLLYCVRWDNGQTSKHYDKELICIGRFNNLIDFQEAIIFRGNVERVVGPQGGFRHVSLEVLFDGAEKTSIIGPTDRKLWELVIEPLAVERGVTITTTKLTKAKPTTGNWTVLD